MAPSLRTSLLMTWLCAIVCFLAALSLITASTSTHDYTSYYTRSSQKAGKHIFITGIPMPGHIFPLLATAEVLAQRGYTVTVATVDRLQNTVMRHKHPSVNYIPIGNCQNAVEDWDIMTVEMNTIPDFAETSTMIFDWVSDIHPCIFSTLYTTLYRAQLGMDFDPQNPDYTILPKVDYILVDIVTHGAQDVARALNIPYIINNPDILTALPAQSIGQFDSLPLLFQESSSLEYNHGIEFRKWTQEFNKHSDSIDGSFSHDNENEANIFNYTQILSKLESRQRITPDFNQPDNEKVMMSFLWNTSFLSRFLLPIARPLVQWFLFLTVDPILSDRRHGISEIFFFKQQQMYYSSIVENQHDKDTFPFAKTPFSHLCADESLMADYNDYLTKNHLANMVINYPTKICTMYTRYQADFDKYTDLFLAPPQNPSMFQEYRKTFEFLHSTSTTVIHPDTPQVKPLTHTPPPQKTNFWNRLTGRFFSRPSPATSNQPISVFNTNSHAQRVWSFYDQLSQHWSGISTISNIPIIQDTVFGVEFSRPTPPYVHMVGPLIPQANSNDLAVLASQSNPAMERQLVWLNGHDDDDETNNTDPIVYMSFGTLGHMDKKGTVALFHAYEYLIKTTNIRVLWKLTSHYVEMVVDAYLESGVHIEGFFDAVEMIPRGDLYLKASQGKIAHYLTNLSPNAVSHPIPHNRWFFTEWVYSQYGVLDHENTAIFVSHCGINSAYESMLSKTYILCIPLFGDQFDMANMISDRNIGTFIAKQYVNKNTIVAGINYALAQRATGTYQRSAQRIKALIKLSGGAPRAADVIEFYVNNLEPQEDGPVVTTRSRIRDDSIDITTYQFTREYVQHKTVEVAHSMAIMAWWQFYNFDVIIFNFILANLIIFLTIKFWMMVLRCAGCFPSHKAVKQEECRFQFADIDEFKQSQSSPASPHVQRLMTSRGNTLRMIKPKLD